MENVEGCASVWLFALQPVTSQAVECKRERARDQWSVEPVTPFFTRSPSVGRNKEEEEQSEQKEQETRAKKYLPERARREEEGIKVSLRAKHLLSSQASFSEF